MPSPFLQLLAAKNEGGWVFGLIFFAIWIVVQVAGAMNKKKEEERARQFASLVTKSEPEAPARVNPSGHPPPRPMRMSQDQRRATVTPQRAQLQSQQVQKAQLAQKKSPRPPAIRETPRTRETPPRIPSAIAIKSTLPPMPQSRPEISDSEIHAPTARATHVLIDAKALHAWLRPATLQKQFILTELMQPPIALREQHLR